MEKVHPAFFLTGLLMLIVPFLFIRIWRSRRPLVVRFFVWGIIAWGLVFFLGEVFNQMFKGDILGFLSGRIPASHTLVSEVFYIALVFTLIECGLLLLVLLRGGYQAATWNQAISLGLGYGFIEMMVFGLLWLGAVTAVFLRADKLPGEVVNQLLTMPWQNFAAPVVERCFTFLAHIYSVVLISYAVRTVRWRHLLWAITYKLAFYSLIAYGWVKYGYRSLMVDVKVTWNIELAVIAFGGLGLAGLLYLGYSYLEIDEVARRKDEAESKQEEDKKQQAEEGQSDGGTSNDGGSAVIVDGGTS